MNRIVAKFRDESLEAIDFYTIKDEYKDFTILEKQTFDAIRFYIYNNKTKELGKLHVIKLPEKAILKDMIDHDHINWLDETILFFWADSIIVDSFGLENNENYKFIYKQLLKLRKDEVRMTRVYNNIKTKGLVEKLMTYLTYKKVKRRQSKYIKEIEKELKVIW